MRRRLAAVLAKADRFDALVAIGTLCAAAGFALSPWPWLALLAVAGVAFVLAALVSSGGK